jgi:two-component system sensor kinase FixL
VIDDATALALVGTQQRGLRPQIDIENELLPVLVDKVQVQQVLVNLIRNAVDAMETTKRYKLVIAARAVGDEKVEVSVCDSGPGLAPEVINRLFQPFTTTKAGGMGVGLSICRTIIQAHGGLIWTQPNPGGGTIFFFTVPTVEQAVPASQS